MMYGKEPRMSDYSESNHTIKLAVDITNNLKKRISLHNSGKGAKFTRGRKWRLIYKEKFKSKKEAISREYYIKNNRLLRNKIKNENFNSSSI